MSMSSNNTTTTSSSDTTTLTGIECNYAATTCTAEISTSDTAECCCGFPRDDNTSSVTHLDDSAGEGTGFVAFDATTLAKIESSVTFSPSVPVCGIPVVTLIVHYKTTPGESIRVSSSSPAFGAWCPENALLMTWTDNHYWTVSFPLRFSMAGDFEYKYIKMEGSKPIWESGPNHRLHYDPAWCKAIVVHDLWNPDDNSENALLTSAFTNVIFRRKQHIPHFLRPSAPNKCILRFQITAPRCPSDKQLCIEISDPVLGVTHRKEMCFAHSPMWTCELEMNPSQNLALDYQVGIIDPKTKSDFVCATEKRRLRVNPKENSLILYVLPMFRPDSPWKGSGVAIPVFSLRSRESTGVGEFLDLIKFIDWARSVGFQLIQLLPINDTISNKKWTDSYPYSSISVHALNPIFLNLQNMGSLDDSLKMKRFAELREHLNGFEFVNWDQVMHAKLTYARLLFNQLGYRALSKSKEFQEFFVTNKFWLTPYAAFSCLRDRFGTAEFSLWPEFHTYNEEEISRFSDDPRNSTEVSFYYFLQYHLHRQMQYVAEYARHSGVVLKGDLPIGVSRNSVDAWTEPQYFNMNYATGAPPDFFAPNGQNWAFPTYNWERMREDGFIWWKRRLASMEKYFDAFRIDHILGFFRIWEIPAHAVTGMLGQFTPTIPLHANELRASGLHLDCERLCRPYIREHFLGEHVGNENVPYVKQTFLVQTAPGCYSFKPEFDTQRKVKDFCDIQKVLRPQEIEKINQIMNGLFILSEQVCLLERPGSNQTEFSPRYALRQSSNRQPPNRSFLELDWNQQRILEHLSTHYFYHRQHDHWAEKAAIKLPPLKAATRMLICGEDLGDHVPAVVGKQMRALDMLSLSIERMPKNQEATFANPDEVPYLSVVSTSSHDVPTLRGWFRSEMATGSRTLRDIWKHMKECHHVTEELEGSDMSAIIAERFISHHLASPAMWAIFPLQDILALDETIRLADPDMEQINNPPNPNHMWRFRFHIATDDLLCASALNNKLMGLSLNNRNTYQHNNHH